MWEITEDIRKKNLAKLFYHWIAECMCARKSEKSKVKWGVSVYGCRFDVSCGGGRYSFDVHTLVGGLFRWIKSLSLAWTTCMTSSCLQQMWYIRESSFFFFFFHAPLFVFIVSLVTQWHPWNYSFEVIHMSTVNRRNPMPFSIGLRERNIKMVGTKEDGETNP